jgi:hypothetical protein
MHWFSVSLGGFRAFDVALPEDYEATGLRIADHVNQRADLRSSASSTMPDGRKPAEGKEQLHHRHVAVTNNRTTCTQRLDSSHC